MSVHWKAMVTRRGLPSWNRSISSSSESEEEGQIVSSSLVDDVGSDMMVFIEMVRVGWSDGLRFRGGVVALGSEGGEGAACLDR